MLIFSGTHNLFFFMTFRVRSSSNSSKAILIIQGSQDWGNMADLIKDLLTFIGWENIRYKKRKINRVKKRKGFWENNALFIDFLQETSYHKTSYYYSIMWNILNFNFQFKKINGNFFFVSTQCTNALLASDHPMINKRTAVLPTKHL